jgi:hypothetical protein
MRRGHPRGRLALTLFVAASVAGCGAFAEWRLQGEWESDATPLRTLTLRPDGSYSQRFSGKTLGFVSELLGPETGRWQVAGGALVLIRSEASGASTTRQLPLDRLSRHSVFLAGEPWHRVREPSPQEP